MTVMLLKINGKLNKYYLQTLCMLFYPGAKFGEDECDNNDESAGAQKIDSGTSELKTGEQQSITVNLPVVQNQQKQNKNVMRHPTRHMKSAFFRQNSQELTVRMASKSPVGLAWMVGLQNLHISNRQTGRADCSEVRSRVTNSGRPRGWRQASRRSELAKNYSARPPRGGF